MNNSRQRQKRKKGNKYYQKHKKDFFLPGVFRHGVTRKRNT